MIQVEQAELKEIIKESVREVIKEEFLKFTIKLTPYVSEQEMEEINNSLKDNDSVDEDYEDITEWLGK